MTSIKENNKDKDIMKVFVLPLYNLSIPMLKEDFVNAYLHKEGTILFIELKTPNTYVTDNSLFNGTFEVSSRLFYVMATPETFEEDMKHIINGEYSRLSPKAKNAIIQLSGEPYMVKRPGDEQPVCSHMLLAMLKHSVYKKIVEDRIGINLADNSELIDKLTEYAFIDHIVNQKV